MEIKEKRKQEVYKMIYHDVSNLSYHEKKVPLTPNGFLTKQANKYKLQITEFS
jgi:hypothetical protein